MKQRETATDTKCMSQASSLQEVSNSLCTLADSEQGDNVYAQGAARNARNSEDLSSRDKNFAMALKLFPEFLLRGDAQERNRSLCTRGRENMRFKDLSNVDKSDENQNVAKTSEDIVQWIRTEYGI